MATSAVDSWCETVAAEHPREVAAAAADDDDEARGRLLAKLTAPSSSSYPNTPRGYRRCDSDSQIKRLRISELQRLTDSVATDDAPQTTFGERLRKALGLRDKPAEKPKAPADLGHRHSFASSSSTGYSSARSSIRHSQPPAAADHSPAAADAAAPTASYLQSLAMELVDTERAYVSDLNAVIQGYLNFLLCHREQLAITAVEVCRLFGNIEQVAAFNGRFLVLLDACRFDLLLVARCFVEQQAGFDVYAHYCAAYPAMVSTLDELLEKPRIREVLDERQQLLGHSLPLAAYLLKPVQRVLKYHLFLQNSLRQWDASRADEIRQLQRAVDCMKARAADINELKRREEHCLRVRHLQSLLLRDNSPRPYGDLSDYGDLILEGTFRLLGIKSTRLLFLFEELLLVTKRKSDGFIACKDFIACAQLLLIESINADPLSFQILSVENPKVRYTFQARTSEQKREWMTELNKLLLEQYDSANTTQIPLLKARTPRNVKQQRAARRDGDALPFAERRRKSIDASADLRVAASRAQHAVLDRRPVRSGSPAVALHSRASVALDSASTSRRRRLADGAVHSRGRRAANGRRRVAPPRLLRLVRLARVVGGRRGGGGGGQSAQQPRLVQLVGRQRLRLGNRASSRSRRPCRLLHVTAHNLSRQAKFAQLPPIAPPSDCSRLTSEEIEKSFSDLWQELEDFSAEYRAACRSRQFPLAKMSESDPVERLSHLLHSETSITEEESCALYAHVDRSRRTQRSTEQRGHRARSVDTLKQAAEGSDQPLSAESTYDALPEWPRRSPPADPIYACVEPAAASAMAEWPRRLYLKKGEARRRRRPSPHANGIVSQRVRQWQSLDADNI